MAPDDGSSPEVESIRHWRRTSPGASSFILHPSSFLSHPSSLIPAVASLILAVAVLASGVRAAEPLAPAGEKGLRQQFFKAYTGAATPQDRAATLQMLVGAKEQATLKQLVNALGDQAPEVRAAACRLMGEHPEPDGYFTKPLTAALTDKDSAVGRAAAEALVSAPRKGLAIKALVFALAVAHADNQDQIGFIHTAHRALVKLTGEEPIKDGEPKDFAKAWLGWWHDHRAAVEAEDAKPKPPAPAPDPAQPPGQIITVPPETLKF